MGNLNTLKLGTVPHTHPSSPLISCNQTPRTHAVYCFPYQKKIKHTHTKKRRPSNQSWGWEEQRPQTQGLVLSQQTCFYFCRWRRPQGTCPPTLENNMSTAHFLLRILSEVKIDKQGTSAPQPLFCSRNPFRLS